MAYLGVRLRKLCRYKTLLLAVPAIWLMTMMWTMYWTQEIQTAIQAEAVEHQVKKTSSFQMPTEPKTEEKLLNEELLAQMAPDADSRFGGIPSDEKHLKGHHKKEKLIQEIEADNYGEISDDRRQYKNQMDMVELQPDVPEIQLENKADKNSILKNDDPDVDHYEVSPFKPGFNNNRKVIKPGVRFDHPKKGEDGHPVVIVPAELSDEERYKFEEGWKNHEYNEYASLQISTQRKIPDFRNTQCKQNIYPKNLPKVSIIICFYNEAWSVLLRTIHSVLTRSPSQLIQEIILVDDFSDMVPLVNSLEKYVSLVDKLRLIRMTKRSGLVRARLAGVKEAKGPVLLFLDSHVECAEGWLEPLLHIIAENPNTAVTPEIDVIDDKTFAVHASVGNIGVLEFKSFSFDWTLITPRLQQLRKSEADPVMSPTMAGGLFAIRKDFFLEMGTYDVGLELWGGENIELSLKLWMCGGGILIHPCSRVAHVFRDSSPYLKGEKSNVLVKNSARVAQVWADDYKKFFFKSPYDEEKYGSVQERVDLRAKLKCHNFGWYLDHVYPEMYIVGSGKYLGQIRSQSGKCISIAAPDFKPPLILTDCSRALTWEFTRINEIRGSTVCLENMSSNLMSQSCNLENSTQSFQYLKETIYHPQSNTCLTESPDGLSLTFQPCNLEERQLWTWPINPDYISTSGES